MSLAICAFLYKIQAHPHAPSPWLYLCCGLCDNARGECRASLEEYGFFRTAVQSSVHNSLHNTGKRDVFHQLF